MDLWFFPVGFLCGCATTGIIMYRRGSKHSQTVRQVCNELDEQLTKVRALHRAVLMHLEEIKEMRASEAAGQKIQMGGVMRNGLY